MLQSFQVSYFKTVSGDIGVQYVIETIIRDIFKNCVLFWNKSVVAFANRDMLGIHSVRNTLCQVSFGPVYLWKSQCKF